jgi:catechol 2,3-dioxygenase-like lactoylglutathione lyase family enzyme
MRAAPRVMADAWLGDFGLRVTNLERSIAFYRQFLDLEELRRVVDEESGYVLLRDRRSGQRMELNWYSEKSPFAVPYTVGEGLDHLEIRVRSVPEMLERCKSLGIPIATPKLWDPERVAQGLADNAELQAAMKQEVWSSPPGHPHRFNAFYIQDPDGIFLCLYDHPDEPWEGPIPDHY